MITMNRPNVDGRLMFKKGADISINHQFEDGSRIIDRLKLDDARPDMRAKYDEKMRPKYEYTKYYLSYDKTEIIVERVFILNETHSWFGVTERKHGLFHLYPRQRSKFPYLRGSNEDYGIFYRYEQEQIVVYTTDDDQNTANNVMYLFENPKKVKKFMESLKQLYNDEYELFGVGTSEQGDKWNFRKTIDDIHTVEGFYPGTNVENTGLIILNV